MLQHVVLNSTYVRSVGLRSLRFIKNFFLHTQLLATTLNYRVHSALLAHLSHRSLVYI